MFRFHTHKVFLTAAVLITCTLIPAFHADAAEDEDGFLIVKKDQKVIIKPLAMLFTERADLKAYQDLYEGHFTPDEAEAYKARLTLSGKAVELKQAAVATVVSQDKATHKVQVQIEDTDPEWVDGCKLDPYSLQRIKHYLDWKELIEPGS